MHATSIETITVEARWRAESVVRNWFMKTKLMAKLKLRRDDLMSWAAIFDKYIKTLGPDRHVVYWGQLFSDWQIDYFQPPKMYRPLRKKKEMPRMKLFTLLSRAQRGFSTLEIEIIRELQSGTPVEKVIEKLGDLYNRDIRDIALPIARALEKERLQKTPQSVDLI